MTQLDIKNLVSIFLAGSLNDGAFIMSLVNYFKDGPICYRYLLRSKKTPQLFLLRLVTLVFCAIFAANVIRDDSFV